MSEFRILAILPQQNCHRDLLKSLTIGELYKFYNDFTFQQDEQQNVIEIKKPKEVIDLYSNGKPEINISAIVGENGSGKSTILEFLYVISLFLSKDQKKMKTELEKIDNRNNIVGGYVKNTLNMLNVEIFYSTPIDSENYEVRSILINHGSITHFQFENIRKPITVEFNLHQFCYSIALNYSLYGLNEIYTPWLAPLFHKNDGYQAPLVINPYRSNGKIDINVEDSLSNARLIQNIVESGLIEYELINEKKTREIEFFLDLNSLYFFYWEDKRFQIKASKDYFLNQNGKSIYYWINSFIQKFNSEHPIDKTQFNRKIGLISEEKIIAFENLSRLGIDFIQKKIYESINTKKGFPPNFNLYLEFLFIEYIIKKIFKSFMMSRYNNNNYKNVIKGENFNDFIVDSNLNQFIPFLNSLAKDNSHFSLKLRQVLFLWDSDFFYKPKLRYGTVTKNKDYVDEIRDFLLSLKLSLEELKQYASVVVENGAVDLELIPGGVFNPKITFEISDSTFKKTTDLSSGELQFLYTIHTIMYHIRNINSVRQSKDNSKILYSNLNLIFDEIELCFHPRFQQMFISELLKNLKKLKIPSIRNINIIFSTHSPFILSDIPSSNILRLKNGKSQPLIEQTFGSNIHDLLANDFFLEKGFIGEFAKEKINDLIHNLSYRINLKEIDLLEKEYSKSQLTFKKLKIDAITAENKYLLKNFNINIDYTKENFDQIIELVGETVIKDKLNEMCKLAFN